MKKQFLLSTNMSVNMLKDQKVRVFELLILASLTSNIFFSC